MKMFPAVILVLPLVIMATHCAAATRIISVAELITACEHNRPPCDGSPNREVAVAGEIFMLNTNAGSPYVSLRGKDHENVQCFFTKEFAKQDSSLLSKLHPGDEVAIAGNLEGKTINVIINKCDWLRVIRSPDELDHSIHDHPHLIKELFTKYRVDADGTEHEGGIDWRMVFVAVLTVIVFGFIIYCVISEISG